MFALVRIAVCIRSCELPVPLGQGSFRIRFANASYCENASSSRFRAEDASAVGCSSFLAEDLDGGNNIVGGPHFRLMSNSWN